MLNNPTYIVTLMSLNEFKNYSELFISDEYISRINKIKSIKRPKFLRKNRNNFKKEIKLLNEKHRQARYCN